MALYLQLHGRMTKTARVDWVDLAKGICIFFVVMFHVNDLVQERFGVGYLDHVVAFAGPFRMPDFFLIAGLFLAASMRRSWREFLDRKVIHFLYLYALWATLSFIAFDLRHAEEPATAYLGRYLDPRGPLWFIHILPIFFVVTRLTRRVPPWAMWFAAATLHTFGVDSGWHVPDQFASRFVFFYSGYALAPHVFRIARWAGDHAAVAIGYLAVWSVGNALLVGAGLATAPGASLVLGYAGAFAVILAAVLLATRRWADPLRAIGASSLTVYLGDALVSTLVVKLLPDLADAGTLALIATVAAIAVALGLRRVLPGFLYERPRWARLSPATVYVHDGPEMPSPRPDCDPPSAAAAPAARIGLADVARINAIRYVRGLD